MEVINKRYDPAVPVDAIKPADRNPNQSDLGALSVSIAHNGFYGACIVNERTGRLVAGEHRWRAAIGEGATTIPVIYVDCDEETAKRILIADNRASRLGDWDYQGLAELLDSIRSDQGDLTGTLYDQEDYDRILSDLANGYVSGLPRDEIQKQQFESPDATVTTDSPDATDVNSPSTAAITPEIEALIVRTWKCIADDWKTVGTPQFQWISPDVTPGVAAWHFVRAKHLSARYPRKMSLAFTPLQLRTSGDSGSPIELLDKIANGQTKLIDRLRFGLEDKPDWQRFLGSASSLPMAGHRIPLDFPADLARDLIDTHCAHGGTILDPCHGWGGRCVGFLLSSKATRYVGCDPSPTAHAGLLRLFSLLSGFSDAHKAADFSILPFEDFQTSERFDFALTSPPYFDREKYDGAETSFRRFLTFDDWVAGFYRPMIAKVFSLLKPDCVFALQVGSQGYPLAEEGKRIASEVGFYHEDSRTQVMSNPLAETTDDKSESVFIFRKPDDSRVQTAV